MRYNATTPTVLCDEEGYDIIPIHMVRVIQDGKNNNGKDEEEIEHNTSITTQEVTN